jgi:hypothetical protein
MANAYALDSRETRKRFKNNKYLFSYIAQYKMLLLSTKIIDKNNEFKKRELPHRVHLQTKAVYVSNPI